VVSPPRGSLLRRTIGPIAAGCVFAFLGFSAGAPARPLLPADDTPPIVAYTIDGIAGAHNWYRGSSGGNYIVVHWSVSDPESPIISTSGCEPAVQIPGPNTGTTRTCSATSDGGTTTVTTKQLKIDATPPTTTATPSRPPNGAGWYRAPFSLTWPGTDATSGIDFCTSQLDYSGPQTSGTTQTGSCTDMAGNTSSSSFLVKYDTVAPTTTATPSRPPNAAGWYKAPAVTINWNGSDATSGIASCDPSITYGGPDTGGTTRTGTCIDNAGNSSSDSFVIRYDTGAPETHASASRPPNAAGWYKAPAVTISWSGTDGLSGIASCRSPLSYGQDTTGTTISGSCTDVAGNSSSDSLLVKYDATPPTTTASPTPGPNARGWYNAPLRIDWNGSDLTSGIASCSPFTTYSGPDTSGLNRTGSCTDVAGNSSSNTFTIRYDTQPPVTTATPSPLPNAAGWHRTPLSLSWGGTDTRSGIDFCSNAVNYGGPDTTGTTRTGTCADNAGNSSSDSYTIKYDATPPTATGADARAPDHNGWYNHAVRIDWDGSDATSGKASCTSRTYSAPDVANGTAPGTCTDNAGNTSTPFDFPLSYDGTDPVVSVTAARNPDHNGWYNQPVRISWSGTDATSGIASCSPPVNYAGPDRSDASRVGGCTDRAGNSASPPPLAFKYDATAPATTAVPSRRADSNGWYNRPLRVDWKGSDPASASGVASCSSFAYSGPDAAGLSRSGVCSDKAGNTSAPVVFDFRYDHTPPTGLTVSPARIPDHDGWYNRPLAVRWSASDALAGIASCTSLTYSGPDTASTDLTGACTDRAGNTAGPLRFALSYDATPPAFKGLFFKARDDRVSLKWRLTGATALEITRSPGMRKAAASMLYDGAGTSFTDRRVENYVKYRYTLTAEDAAGNTAKRSIVAKPMPALFAPRPEAHVRPYSSPFFAWRPVQKARYYNLQLWLDGQAIGAWWPPKPWLKLASRWRFRGKSHRLKPGTYTWYVWPGRGPRRAGKYGPLIGKSTFVAG
jgi:large repetitive protein